MTDRDGHFRLNRDPEASYLVAVHERGVVWVGAKDLSMNLTVNLQRWGKVEGTVWEYDQPVTNQEVWHSSELLADRASRGPGVELAVLRGMTDAQGHFAFDFVPPGKHRFYRMIPAARGSSSGPAEMVQVKAGETASLKVGGVGRPVTGRFTIKNPYVAIEWRKDQHTVNSVTPKPPENLKTAEEYEAWRNREDIQRAFDAVRHHPLQFAEDGSFRIDEMIPGKYQFFIRLYDPRDRNAFAYSKYIAQYTETFEVPDTEKRNSREPLDVGVFELSLKPQIEEGKTFAPGFTALDMDGKEFKLSGFKGKYVLLDFWATWCGPCIAEMPYLREAQKKFGARGDFVMISLSLDDAIDKPRAFVKKNDMPWNQGYLGRGEVPEKYGVNGIPAIFLINPEGKIIAKELRGGAVCATLGKWLK